MVIGNGMIANKFAAYKNVEDIIIFASGVSNSKDTNKENYEREFQLLKNVIKNSVDKTLVYFSTCSIRDVDLSSSSYVIHKKKIENFIKENAQSFYLFRISNLAGISNNPYTLLNYFIFNILKEHPLVVWKNAFRNIIGIDDMFSIADYFLSNKKNINTTINVANEKNYSVPYIIKCIEEHLNKKGIYKQVDRGESYTIDTSIIEPALKELKIEFKDDYLSSLLKKYYHSR